MAQTHKTKSKSQKAKASAARQARKAKIDEMKASGATDEEVKAVKEAAQQEVVKKDEKERKPKKERFKFFKEVRGEMKRVTWPTRTEVLRWTGVVVGALLFFGVFVAVLDNLVVTPIIVAISGLGA